MDTHICKQCGKAFSYCRACAFKPIGSYESGFCSAECRTAFRQAEQKQKIEISNENEEIHE